MRSPEYPDKAGPNTNYQLALTKWGLVTLLKVCDLLTCDEPRRPVFEDVLKNMVSFPGKARQFSAQFDLRTTKCN
jgi:hypothetical protein